MVRLFVILIFILWNNFCYSEDLIFDMQDILKPIKFPELTSIADPKDDSQRDNNEWAKSLVKNRTSMLSVGEKMKEHARACYSSISASPVNRNCYESIHYAFLFDASVSRFIEDIEVLISNKREELKKITEKEKRRGPQIEASITELERLKKEAEKYKEDAKVVAGGVPDLYSANNSNKQIDLKSFVTNSNKIFLTHNASLTDDKTVKMESPLLEKVSDELINVKDTEIQKKYFEAIGYVNENEKGRKLFKEYMKSDPVSTGNNTSGEKENPEGKKDNPTPTGGKPDSTTATAPASQTTTGKPGTEQKDSGKDTANPSGSLPDRNAFAAMAAAISGGRGSKGERTGLEGIDKVVPKTPEKTEDKKAAADTKSNNASTAAAATPVISSSGGGGAPALPSSFMNNWNGNDWRNDYMNKMNQQNAKPLYPGGGSRGGVTAHFATKDGNGSYASGNKSLWESLTGSSDSSVSTPTKYGSSPSSLSSNSNSSTFGGLLENSGSNYGSGNPPVPLSADDEKRQRMDYLKRMAEQSRLTRDAGEEQASRYVNPFDLINSITWKYMNKGETLLPEERSNDNFLLNSPRSDE